jgi:hypothetical protein
METLLIILLYIVSGWIALLAVQRFRSWSEDGRRDSLWDGLVHASAATVAIAYLVWWPLLVALTWQWVIPRLRRRDEAEDLTSRPRREEDRKDHIRDRREHDA